jgi:hypothetical protein
VELIERRVARSTTTDQMCIIVKKKESNEGSIDWRFGIAVLSRVRRLVALALPLACPKPQKSTEVPILMGRTRG